MTLVIKQCKNRPIIEVFDCELISEQTKRISTKSRGFYRFSVMNPRFYHFGQNVKNPGGNELVANSEYRIVWHRG